MIAAVRQALLGDIFVLITRSYPFLVLIPSLIKSLISCNSFFPKAIKRRRILFLDFDEYYQSCSSS